FHSALSSIAKCSEAPNSFPRHQTGWLSRLCDHRPSRVAAAPRCRGARKRLARWKQRKLAQPKCVAQKETMTFFDENPADGAHESNGSLAPSAPLTSTAPALAEI